MSQGAISEKPCFFIVCQCASVVFLFPGYAVLHSTIVPFNFYTKSLIKFESKKLCPPASPVDIFTATFPFNSVFNAS